MKQKLSSKYYLDSICGNVWERYDTRTQKRVGRLSKVLSHLSKISESNESNKEDLEFSTISPTKSVSPNGYRPQSVCLK